MANILICHGAWSGGWSWRKLRAPLLAAGHDVFTPTYTGVGERSHLAHPMVDLETHVQDILAVIDYEDLRDIVLVAHSYGGMVGTAVGDRVPDRIRHLIYLDAFVPEDGQSLQDLVVGSERPDIVAGWLIPPLPPAPDTSPEDLDWTARRRGLQPLRCFTQKLLLSSKNPPPFKRSYIHCTRKAGVDNFRQFADRFRNNSAWTFHELDASHAPNVTEPQSLAALLISIA